MLKTVEILAKTGDFIDRNVLKSRTKSKERIS